MNFSAQLSPSGNNTWDNLLHLVYPQNGLQCDKKGTDVLEISLENWEAMFGEGDTIIDTSWIVENKSVKILVTDFDDISTRVKIGGGVPPDTGMLSTAGVVWYWTVTCVAKMLSGATRLRSIWLRVQG